MATDHFESQLQPIAVPTSNRGDPQGREDSPLAPKTLDYGEPDG
jgi:hypothetical protein